MKAHDAFFRLAVRAGLSGFLGVLVMVSILLAVDLVSTEPITFTDVSLFALAGFIAGAVTAPVVLVEAIFAARPPSRRRDAVAASASVLIAFFGLWLGVLQGAYLLGAAKGGLRVGLHFATRAEDEIARDEYLRIIFYALATPFAGLTVARMRALGLRRQIGAATAGALVLSPPALIFYPLQREWGFFWMGTGPSIDAPEVVWLAGLVVFSAALLPVAYRVGDRLESRARGLIARRQPA